jgi:FMN phosphatase YigB (HAD superfamily)
MIHSTATPTHNSRGNVVLITDLDNTLYNFVDYFAPAFRAMVHALSWRLRVDEVRLVEEFKEVYEKYGTVEYSFSVQELPSVSGCDQETITKAVKSARIAFGQSRRVRLKLYPGVAQILTSFVAQGGVVCAVTNAPAYHAYVRLRYLGIEKLFRSIGAWEGTLVPTEGEAQERYARRLQHIDSSVQLSIRSSRRNTKPSTFMIQKIFEEFGGPNTKFFAVGDSIQRDLRPCAEFGMTTIWARYGKNTEDRNQQTLDGITPWNREEFRVHYEAASEFSPDYTIDEFSALSEILPFSVQRELF